MKKLSIILAVSALALAGCAKNDTNTIPETTKYVKVSIPVPSQTRTSVNGDTYTSHWQAGDTIRLYVKNSRRAKFRLQIHGARKRPRTGTDIFLLAKSPESLIDKVVSVSACYPYNEQLSYTWDNGWVISESFLDKHHTHLSNYDILYTLATEAKLEYTDDTQSEAELEANMTFKPLMARIKSKHTRTVRLRRVHVGGRRTRFSHARNGKRSGLQRRRACLHTAVRADDARIFT
ncbi:MAG: fimbrillin family protein [Alistipes putredinis]|nr:MAG: fimbrillin family protein [Alistipes putredinis]